MAVTARKYNPGFLTDDEMVASFCVRTAEFEAMVEALRECTGRSNTHQIVIGPRGSGKTSLLLRVAAELRRDPELQSGFFPIVFAEESYEVATAGEFWLECLARLAAQAPRGDDDPDLHRTLEELRALSDDRILGDRCLGALQDFSDRQGKRLVLLVENLNMMFKDMSDPDAGWRLRKVLQTEPRIVMLASATTRFDEIDDPEHALYEQFRVISLRPLDTEECAVLWETVAGRGARSGTIRSLEILTGGSPRLLTIVARFGTELSFRKLMANLLDLIDDHTEYFKSHLESLPAQERRVYLALAALWKPATTREISDQARIDTSKCSSQLKRLVERGAVRTAGGSARRKQYYLTERLYNIYYLLRRSRRSDHLVEAVIRFMESYYSPSELKIVGTRIIHEAESFMAETQSPLRAALAQLIELPALARDREELLAMMPKVLAESLGRNPISLSVAKTAAVGVGPDRRRALPHEDADERPDLVSRALFDKAIMLTGQNQIEDTLATCDEVVRRFGDSDMPTVLNSVARALAYKGLTLYELNRLEDTLTACEEVVRRFRENDTPVILDQVAIAIFIKGVVFDKLNRTEDALATYDEAVDRLGKSGTPTIRDLIPTTLVNRGLILGRMNRQQEELSSYDEVVRRFESSETPIVLNQVAKALFHKGLALNGLDRPEEALAAYDGVVCRFEASETPDVVELVAKAFFFKGTTLDRLNRLEEALAAYGDAVCRFEQNETPTAVELFANALFLKALTLDELNRSEEALATYDEVVRRCGESDAPAHLELGAKAAFYRGQVLDKLNRTEEALAAYEETVRRFGESDSPGILDLVARGFLHKGLTLDGLNRPEEALAAYNEVVHQFGQNETPAVLESVAKALFHKGLTLGTLNRAESALSACDEAVRRFGENEKPAVLESVAKTLFWKGSMLVLLSRPEEALAAYDEVVRRFGESEPSAVFDPISMALVVKGHLLHTQNRAQDALATFDKAVQRFEESESPSAGVSADFALLGKADLELKLEHYEEAAEAAGQMLDRGRTQLPENRLRGHLIRGKALLACGDRRGSKRDVAAFLTLLPEIGYLPKTVLDALMFFSVVLGSEHMGELIKGSPAADILLPLTTALELELGLEPRVALEVKEVAEDIRRDLAKLREEGADGLGGTKAVSPEAVAAERKDV